MNEKEDARRSHKKRIQAIPLNMGWANNTSHGGQGGNGKKRWPWPKRSGKGPSAVVLFDACKRCTFLPLAQAIRARMVRICSAPQWRLWLPMLVPRMAMKLPRNGPAEKRFLPPSLPIHKSYWIGMWQWPRQPESAYSWGSRVWGLRRQQLRPKSSVPPPIAGSSRNCTRWMTKLPRVTSSSTMRARWSLLMMKRWLIVMRGVPTKKLLRAWRRAGIRSTLC